MGQQAGLAQLVERFSCKEDVVGSSPTPGSRLTILVVTNAYPAPERPAYGIYVARLVAALERDGHEVVLAASSEQGGGWRTLRKYARLAWRPASAARSAPARCGLGPLPGADRDRSPAARPARPRVPYALTAHGTDVANAERSPRIRKATRAGRRRRLRRLRRLGRPRRAPGGSRRPARRPPARRQRGRRSGGVRRRRRGGRGRRARMGCGRSARRSTSAT